MADNSGNDSDRDRSYDGTSSSNDILLKIQQLEKEKAEIEKRNREKESLEKKLKDLQKNVSALKNSSPLTSTPGSSGSNRRSKKDDSPSMNLSESINKLKNKLDKSLHSEHDESDSNNESDNSSEEEEEVEEVMSAHHKQKLQTNRDTLVENMIPDDIFNDLIAGKVLTSADVNRIKKKSSTRESINEELLNNIVLKSDRAFYVFTKSLRKTLQEYLANRIDPPQKAKKKKRKRQQKEMNISVDVEDITQINKKQPTCTCQEVEEQILILSKNAYRSIRRRDESASAFEQFRKELSQTNTVIKDSMEIMNTLKLLCRHGEITGVFRGSIKFSILISDVQDLQLLWSLYVSGHLLSSLQSTLVTAKLKKYFLVKDIQLGVRIDEVEFQSCFTEMTSIGFKTKGSAVVERRAKGEKKIKLQDCPCLDSENSPSPKSFQFHSHGPRKAFSELPKIVNGTCISMSEDVLKSNACEKCQTTGTSSFHHLRSHYKHT